MGSSENLGSDGSNELDRPPPPPLAAGPWVWEDDETYQKSLKALTDHGRALV